MTINKLSAKTGKWLWVLPLFLGSLVFILDGRYFTSPPLRSDDWNLIVEPAVFNPLGLIQWYDRRPLQRTLLAILTPIFKLQIHWYYVVNWLILFFSAVIIYFIIKKAFEKHAWLALPVAAISLIYPVSYARTWLNIFSNNFAFLVSLLGILWLVEYARRGKIWLLILANIACLYSLLAYEASLGIILLAAGLLMALMREIPKKRRLAMATIFVSVLIFLVWRTYIQPTLLDFQDFYISSMDTAPLTILSRYVQGLFIFIYNWFGPIFQIFGEFKYWVFIGVSGAGVMIFLALTPKLLKSARANADFPFQEKVGEIRSLIRIALIGGLFWAAGYLPVIFLWAPRLYEDNSRVNYSSIPGASLALVAGVAALVTFLAQKREDINRIVTILVIPLVILGIVYQVHSQNRRFQVWETNKSLWQRMFETVPNLESGTKVVLVISGFDSLTPFDMLPFRGDWEAESALRVLYSEPELFAEYYYIDLPALPDNWVPMSEDFSNYVFGFYDIKQDQFRLIEDPVSSLRLPVSASGYDPGNRISEFHPEVARYRFLVE